MEARFWPKVDRSSGPDACWNWIACLRKDGYGQIGNVGTGTGGVKRLIVEGMPRVPRAHRVAYELVRGPIPDGLTIDHLCRNRGCVNPYHLEAVTGSVNTLRGTAPSALNAAKTHCYQGHEFTDANTRIETNGSRTCKTCRNAYMRDWKKRNRRAA